MFQQVGLLLGASVGAGVLVAGVALPAVGGVGLAARNGARGFENLPGKLETPPLPQRSRILAADGSTIATVFSQNRISVSLDRIAPIMRKALLAIEDSRFRKHGALDLKGTMRALATDLRTGRASQGGSTLTQQYVKRVLIQDAGSKEEVAAAQASTLTRKLHELRYAQTVEETYSKDEILQRYLNIAYFGDGTYGVEAAARHYFRRHASKLNLRQSALLAGLVQSPTAYDPTNHPKAAKKRRDTVLARMAQLNVISDAQAKRAMRTGLGLRVHNLGNGCNDSEAPFFCEYVLAEVKRDKAFGKTRDERAELLRRGGLTIKTTLDWQAQKVAKRALDHYVPAGDSDGKAAAETMIEPGTGEIKAMAVSLPYGSGKDATTINLAADYAHGGNRGAPSGSTFKSFTLAAALAQGIPFGTTINAPYHITVTGLTNCDGAPTDTWPVHNASRSENGPYNLKTGTWSSVNTFFAQLEKKVGLCDAVETARKLGMVRANGEPLSEVPSFTLGPYAVDPAHLAAAYATFGARGEHCDPIAITAVTDSDGHKLPVPEAGCEQVIDPEVTDGVSYILQGVLTRGTAAGRGIGRPAAGKTGTTNDNSAAWFAGYTPDLAAAVWVGDPRGGGAHPLQDVSIGGHYYGRVEGASIPAPIWSYSMQHALEGTPASSFHSPPGRMFRGLGESVPDVVGMAPGEAYAKLQQAGFSPTVSPNPIDSQYSFGTVAETSPAGGARVAEGSAVTIYVSRGQGGPSGGGNGGGGPGGGGPGGGEPSLPPGPGGVGPGGGGHGHGHGPGKPPGR